MGFLKSLFHALFYKRTLDDVIGSFKSTLNEIAVLVSENEQRIAYNAEVIVNLQQENTQLNAENLRAIKVITNITKLIEE